VELIYNPSGILLLIIPVFFALSVFLVPKNFVKAYGLIGGLASLLMTVMLLMNYNPQSGMVSIMKGMWMPSLGITKNFGYDAISLIMVLLTAVLVPLILLSNYARELASNKLFTAMVFLMQFGLVGVFLWMDAVWF
jgi:NADH-quinone oxidoreductase subunit M